MVPTRFLISASIAAVIAFVGADAFSTPRGHGIGIRRASSSLCMAPKGSAAKPFEKKKIAVFGAGGYLGAVLFGFLQRASSLYGTGIAGGPSPRMICATGGSSEALNKVLGASFKLAYAGEDLMRIVDTDDANHIEERLKSFDAAILATTYQLERRSVTMNTYEKSPNDKTYEMYLDERYGAWENDVPSNDSDIHTSIFRHSVQACKDAGLSHVVVVETPRTEDPGKFSAILEEEGIEYTYIRTGSPLKKDITYTFEKGITNKLEMVSLPAGSALASFDVREMDNKPAVYREDLAALIVQSLMTLDWKESRILEVSATPGSTVSSAYGGKMPKGLRFDKEWCPNSELLGEVLSTV